MKKCIHPMEKRKQKKHMNKTNAKKFLEKINLWKMKIQILNVNKICFKKRTASKKRSSTKIGSTRIIVGIITSLEIIQQVRKQKSLLATLMSTASSSTAISTKIRIRK